jgi:hypothetical protein
MHRKDPRGRVRAPGAVPYQIKQLFDHLKSCRLYRRIF